MRLYVRLLEDELVSCCDSVLSCTSPQVYKQHLLHACSSLTISAHLSMPNVLVPVMYHTCFLLLYQMHENHVPCSHHSRVLHCLAITFNGVQPSWWDEYEEGLPSSASSPHRELPVSSSIPNSHGTPSSATVSPRHTVANGHERSSPAGTPTAQQTQKVISLQEAVRTLGMTGSWVNAMQPDAKHPPPRYEHAANLIGRSLYIIGGNCGKVPPRVQSGNACMGISQRLSCLT